MDNDLCRQSLYLEHSASDRLKKLRGAVGKYNTGAQRFHEEAVNTAQRGIERGVNAVKNAPSRMRDAAARYNTAAQRVHENAVNIAQRGITPLGDAVKNAASKARMAWNTNSAEFKAWKKNYNHDYYRSHKDLWEKYNTTAQRVHEEAVGVAQRGIEKGVNAVKNAHSNAVKNAERGIEVVAGAPKGIHEEAVKVAQRGIEKGVDTVKGIHQEAVKVAQDKMEPYLDKAREKAGELKDAAKAKARRAIESAAKRAIESVRDVATNPETYKTISDVGKTIGESIASELKNTDFSSLGRDIFSAIKQGMNQ